MVACRIRVHVVDADSREPLPGLYKSIQLLRLSELHRSLEGDPVRTPIHSSRTKQFPEYVEYEFESDSPFIGEVRVYDPPPDSWPVQEWLLVRPGADEDVWIAVYQDAASWPGNQRDKLRDILWKNTSGLMSYSGIKGRIIAPEGQPFYKFIDTAVRLKKVEDTSMDDSLPLSPTILPRGMAESWFDVPIPPGTWDLVAFGTRIETLSLRLDLIPGGIVDVGDVQLTLRDPERT
ncbi:MAG TPA: hypothetical protein VE981_09655 [Planctomycetota bacterium]|nr:hypothetical protein [Planctomycetota bacterium]